MDHGSRVLVTGGSGFIGTNLIIRLRELGHEVVNLDREAPRNRDHRFLMREADLLDPDATRKIVRSVHPDHIVHLGARTDLGGEALSEYAVNTVGTENLLEAAASLDSPPRLIAASTRMVCRIGHRPLSDLDYCPPNAYGESKAQMERIIQASSYRGTWLLVRPTSIWGPWFGVPYRDFFLAVSRGRYRHPAGRRILKSFGYVMNTVHQILGLMRASEADVTGQLFYLADYEPIEVLDWARRIQAETGGPTVKTVPIGVLRAVAAGGDLLKRLGWRDPPLTSFRLRNLTTEMLYDLDPVQRLVPELPVSVNRGIQQTVAWMRASGALGRLDVADS